MLIEQRERIDDGEMAARLIHPFDSKKLEQVHAFLMDEALSNGGNIRDKTLTDITQFARSGGQILAMMHGSEIIAAQTLEPVAGTAMPWWYINNGHTRNDWRGLGIASRLVSHAIALNGPEVGYFAIYVRHQLFERLEFREIDLEQLRGIDDHIARIVREKLRPDKEAHIFIRMPQRQHASQQHSNVL